MDTGYIRRIERESADALLDAGVSVPLLSFGVPLTGRRIVIRGTMRRPTLGGLMRIARLYCRLGVTSDELWRMSKEEEMKFLSAHGREVSRMVAVTMLRGHLRRRMLEGLLGWIVRHRMRHDELLGVMKRFVLLLGTDPFISIIRSAEGMNPLKPRLSREAKGS